MVNMAVQYKLAMAGWNGTSKPPRSTKLLCFLLRSSLAAPLLTPCLSRPPIDSASVPERAPALLAGTKGRIFDRWNPDVAAHVTDRRFHRLPAHGRNYT